MKHLIGLLYLTTAILGLYWAVYLTLTGLYGIPFSRWYVVLVIGGVALLIGSILWWTSSREWTRWLPIIGSLLLSAYFIPGFITVARQGRVDLVRVLILLLVLTSLVIAIRSRHMTAQAQLHRQM